MNNFFYGTWELDGILKNINTQKAEKLIRYAKKMGINKFDTALVYGNGKVEKMLGKITTEDDIILTKLPAIMKPKLDAITSTEYYPKGYIIKKIKESQKNLSRKTIDIVLLHNWSSLWTSEEPCLNELIQLKNTKKVNYVGISLPNNYNCRLDEHIVNKIDYIEAPLNIENTWIINDLEYYQNNNVKVILRSLLLQGKAINDYGLDIENIIDSAMKFKTYITIGMTSELQIEENVKILKKVSENSE